jgi:hypothetical protein
VVYLQEDEDFRANASAGHGCSMHRGKLLGIQRLTELDARKVHDATGRIVVMFRWMLQRFIKSESVDNAFCGFCNDPLERIARHP